MATTKIISKHGHTKEGIDYILNPEKTVNLAYTSTINCSISIAHEQFDIVQRNWRYGADSLRKPYDGAIKKNVTSLHIVQSFKSKETTPEQAHEIAQELIRAKYGEYAQAVIATHIDAKYIHNHIFVNSVDIMGKKFYNNKANLYDLRRHSDELCRKYGLPVLEVRRRTNGHSQNNIQARSHQSGYRLYPKPGENPKSGLYLCR